jgi:ketosteroid isomerase-like protein
MNHTPSSVLAAADRLVEAFGNHDTKAYFAAFAPDASFIFYNLDRVLRTRAEYEAEWQLWESRDGFRVMGCKSTDRAVSMAGDAAVFSHTVETDVVFGEQQVTNLERETIVFSRNDAGEWQAIHEHLSAMPVAA